MSLVTCVVCRSVVFGFGLFVFFVVFIWDFFADLLSFRYLRMMLVTSALRCLFKGHLCSCVSSMLSYFLVVFLVCVFMSNVGSCFCSLFLFLYCSADVR